MKKLFIFIACLFSFSCFACPDAVSPSDPAFCGSFATATDCICEQYYGMPHGYCMNMGQVYKQFVGQWGGDLTLACDRQASPPGPQDPNVCIADWTAYNSRC